MVARKYQCNHDINVQYILAPTYKTKSSPAKNIILIKLTPV